MYINIVCELVTVTRGLVLILTHSYTTHTIDICVLVDLFSIVDTAYVTVAHHWHGDTVFDDT